jgi:secondary thiamine-phosphate synthase enzyme
MAEAVAHRESFEVDTSGRGFFPLDAAVRAVVARAGVAAGLCTLFLHHTSASLLITENADPDVRRDLEAWLARLVQDGDPLFRHTAEGDDDMSAHVKHALLPQSLSVPVVDGALDLGTWQGLWLWEHRARAHRRRVTVVVTG